jgi:hypothetical protein
MPSTEGFDRIASPRGNRCGAWLWIDGQSLAKPVLPGRGLQRPSEGLERVAAIQGREGDANPSWSDLGALPVGNVTGQGCKAGAGSGA